MNSLLISIAIGSMVSGVSLAIFMLRQPVKPAPMFSGYALRTGKDPSFVSYVGADNPATGAAPNIVILRSEHVTEDDILRVYDASDMAKLQPWRSVVAVEVFRKEPK